MKRGLGVSLKAESVLSNRAIHLDVRIGPLLGKEVP